MAWDYPAAEDMPTLWGYCRGELWPGNSDGAEKAFNDDDWDYDRNQHSGIPMSFDLDKLRNELIRDEGLRLTAYRDSLGNLTIGVGHLIGQSENLKTITRDQAFELLDSDIAMAERRLTNIFPSWRSLDEVRQRAFLNLTFNLGYKLADFKRFLHAAKSEDWEKAADHLIQSRWYKQVKLRGPRIVYAIRTGTEWRGE